MVYEALSADGRTITYRDGKRHYWLLSVGLTLIVPATVGLHLATQHIAAVFLPLLIVYVLLPLLDFVVGEDPHNPPEEVVAAMAADRYYSYLLYAAVPLFHISFLIAVWFVGTHDLPWWAVIAFAWGTGLVHGDSLTVGHELGHKNAAFDRLMARLMNSLCGYGHFCIEHNRGHHAWVSTPQDPASSRMGESVYRFALRELPGTFRRGIAHERARLARQGRTFWTISNEVLQGYAITLAVAATCLVFFGWGILPFLLLHHFMGWYTLTQANYIEHYGLLRKRLPDGRYEPVQPHHSWNTNHIASNLLLFQLQRHSDHHANPQRPYQALRDFPELPRLPSGYPGCYALATIPPLWFRVMDRRVMAWAGGDLSKVNVHPPARAALERVWGHPAP